MYTSIIATGCVGVWRIQHFELDECDVDVESRIAEDFPPLQPKEHEFILVELCIGEVIPSLL